MRHDVIPVVLTEQDVQRLWSRIDQVSDPDGCWLWTGGTRTTGYGVFPFVRDGAWAGYQAHRAAWVSVNGPIPDGLFVCHRCDVRLCCRPDHLFLGTQADNIADALAKGRFPSGERNGAYVHRERIRQQRTARGNYGRLPGESNPAAKLTEDDVREARRLFASGVTKKAIGARFGVSSQTICNVISGKHWGHVP